ncbi:MAG TPA: hypothetical protein VFQ53_11990 [Kofleriaceae bacterium]|nr:hypothetical protein [Kofleriaceae bacterium]
MARSPARRIATIAGVLLAVWIVFLVILGAALGGRYQSGVAERLGESLHGESSVGDADLALVRGRLDLDDLRVRRDDAIGKLSLDVGDVRCELRAFGGALFDRTCQELRVSHVRLEISTTALFRVHRPKRPPMHADSVVIEDAVLVFTPSALVPTFGQMQIAIEHAQSGPTTFKTPLSWLLSLQALRAAIDLPGGLKIQLEYRNGILTAAGSLFGSDPVALPIALPIADAADDGQAEMKKITKLGKDLAERVLAQRAQDWLKQKLR